MTNRGRSRILRPVFALVAVGALVFGGLTWHSLNSGSGSGLGSVFSKPRAAFPDVDTAHLSPARLRIVEALRAEYDDPQPGEHYAEGVTEPWCADFVSSILRRAGVPLSNPNSGSWRIPGVATLTDYYRSVGRFRGPEYRPRPGDVALYGPPNRLGQHTNVVVAVDGDRVITVGGNEPPTEISVNDFDRISVHGLIGYGLPA